MATSKSVTLAKYGLTGALGAILSLTVTTLTATTANLTTANVTTANIVTAEVATGSMTTLNVQTLSGGTISATDVGDSVEATTLSGGTIKTTSNGVEITGSSVEAGTLSGGVLYVRKATAGTGTILVEGSAGTAFCFRNTAGTLKVVTIVTATLTVRNAVAGDGCGS